MATAKKTTATANDMEKKVKDFGKAMGDGIAATKVFADIVEHAAKKNMDTRYIAAAITNQHREGDHNGAQVAKKIVAEVFKGATFGKSKDGRTVTIRTKKATVNADALANLMEAVKEKLNFRGTLLKKVQGKKTTVDKDAAWVENNATPNLVKNAIAAGLSEAQILGMVRKQFKEQTAVN